MCLPLTKWRILCRGGTYGAVVGGMESVLAQEGSNSLKLTKVEINEDLYLLTGQLPRSHPRRRPAHVQEMLNRLVPGAPLDGLTPETYLLPPKEN
uniref:Uncharacterized protein n=1 Tax=Arundo donax TaxID=35708 RepID=A0A0A9DWJ2_ARUDO